MNDDLVWLIFIAFGVLAFTVFQLKESRFQRLKKEHKLLEKAHDAIQEECKRTEFNLNQLQISLLNSRRLNNQLQELRSDLKSAKMSTEFLSAKRL